MPSPPCAPADAGIEQDAVLMRRLSGGDDAAYRQLVHTHLGRVTGLAYRMLNDAAEAEEVGQEVFLRLWRTAPTWRPEARIGTWLYRVAYNLCIDCLRKRRATDDDAIDDIADDRSSVLTLHQRDQTRRIVEQAIARLPERQRAAITMVHFNETGNIAAAEAMGVSVDALESLLARGRRRLREELAALKSDLMGDL